MHRSIVALTSVVLLAACGGGAPPDSKTPETTGTSSATPPPSAAPTTPAPTAADAPLPLAPLELPDMGKSTFKLAADGSVLKDGKAAGKLDGREMKGADGKTFLTLKSDGSLVYTLGDAEMHFDAKDVLHGPEGSTFTVEDDGTVRMTANGKTATAQLKGFTPPLRRTGLFFFGCYLLLKMQK